MNWWRKQDMLIRALTLALVAVGLLCICATLALGANLLLSRGGTGATQVAVLVTPTGAASSPTATAAATAAAAATAGPATAEAMPSAIALATSLGSFLSTPMIQCTPPSCQFGDLPSCPSGDCPGGCGVVCQPILGGTAIALPTLPLFSLATNAPVAEPTPTAEAPAQPTVACGEDLRLDELRTKWGADHPIIKLVQDQCLWVLDSFQADVTGDGVPDDIFITADAGCGSCHGQTVHVFVNGKLSAEYSGSDLSIQVHDDHLGFDVVEASFLDTDPMCCPTNLKVTPFLWAATGFVPQPSQVVPNPNKQ